MPQPAPASSPAGAAGAALARRLRELRELRWPEVTLTQAKLAQAFGGGTPLGLSTISSWESPNSPTTPSRRRLAAYATFFATKRSLEGPGPHVLAIDELSDTERAERAQLLRELLALRDGSSAAAAPSTWRFLDGAPIRLVCGRPPDEVRVMVQQHPYAATTNPNYVALLSYADTDAMVELFGHVRAMNPASDVRFRLADELEPDDLTGHVVLLGGLGSRQTASWFVAQVDMPVNQVDDASLPHGDPFVLTVNGEQRRFVPVFAGDGLVEDVGLLVRMPNPLNTSRTLTLCNGVCGRGVLGAVRCLTDGQLRDHNEAYLSGRFGGSRRFGLLLRVPVLRGNTLTPDLNNASMRLYEWPEGSA